MILLILIRAGWAEFNGSFTFRWCQCDKRWPALMTDSNSSNSNRNNNNSNNNLCKFETRNKRKRKTLYEYRQAKEGRERQRQADERRWLPIVSVCVCGAAYAIQHPAYEYTISDQRVSQSINILLIFFIRCHSQRRSRSWGRELGLARVMVTSISSSLSFKCICLHK